MRTDEERKARKSSFNLLIGKKSFSEMENLFTALNAKVHEKLFLPFSLSFSSTE